MKQLVVTLILLLASSVCLGQSTNQGSITGTVTDPTGALIPGAQVVVRNVDTRVAQTVKSNSQGDYLAEFLLPGKYEVTAELEGFKKTTVTGLVLTVGQLMRVDLKLQVGSVAQQVTVSSTAAAINSETPAIGNVIPTQAIENLPLNGREFAGLAVMVPGGSTQSPKDGQHTSKGYNLNFDGNRSSQNSWVVDGAPSVDPLYNQLITSPTRDSIKEFRVETNLYLAQYGRSGGASISVVTKSGTNSFHGSLYEFYRGKALDVRPVFATQPKSQLPNFPFNQYGGSIDGPIKKDKTFFFFALERYHQKAPGSLFVSWAPTALERVGDLSQTINRFTGQPVVLRNPFIQIQDPGMPPGYTQGQIIGAPFAPWKDFRQMQKFQQTDLPQETPSSVRMTTGMILKRPPGKLSKDAEALVVPTYPDRVSEMEDNFG